MHVLRDNRTNETDVGHLSRAGASWATPDYRDRQVGAQHAQHALKPSKPSTPAY